MRRFSRRNATILFLSIFGSLIVLVHSATANVDLLYFRANNGIEAVTLEWETASELDNLGFNILRSESGELGDALPINDTLIPSLVGGQPIGAYYDWVDEDVQPNITYTYWLQDIDFNGASQEHGPVEAFITGGSVIPTSPPVNTSQPAETATNTPVPTHTATSTPVQQPVSSPTATPRNSATPSPTRTSAPTSSTATSVEQTRPAESSQGSTLGAQTPIAAGTEGVSENSPALIATAEESDAYPSGQQAQDENINSMVDSAEDSSGALLSDADAGTHLAQTDAQKIGEKSGQDRENGALDESGVPASRPTSLAVIVLVGALILALGGGIAVWLLLKPRTADG